MQHISCPYKADYKADLTFDPYFEMYLLTPDLNFLWKC